MDKGCDVDLPGVAKSLLGSLKNGVVKNLSDNRIGSGGSGGNVSTAFFRGSAHDGEARPVESGTAIAIVNGEEDGAAGRDQSTANGIVHQFVDHLPGGQTRLVGNGAGRAVATDGSVDALGTAQGTGVVVSSVHSDVAVAANGVRNAVGAVKRIRFGASAHAKLLITNGTIRAFMRNVF